MDKIYMQLSLHLCTITESSLNPQSFMFLLLTYILAHKYFSSVAIPPPMDRSRITS